MLDFNIDIDKKDISNITNKLLGISDGIKSGLQQAMLYAESEAKQSFGQSGNLKSRSGRLRSSITSGVNGSTGWLTSNLPYAAIHEYGGEIKPKKAKFLKFMIQGQWRSVKKVIIPARPFLNPAINNNIETIKSIITDAIMQRIG